MTSKIRLLSSKAVRDGAAMLTKETGLADPALGPFLDFLEKDVAA